jgi:hypothetical protein
MAVDERRIREFIEKSSTRETIAAAVRHAGFYITWVKFYHHELWGFYLKPDKNIEDLFGISREILLWVSEFDEFQPRSITQACEIVDLEQPRLSDEVAIIVSASPNTQSQVVEASSIAQTHPVGFSLEEFSQFEPFGRRLLIGALQQQLYTKDLYFLSGAITNRRSFFGREGLLKEIVATLSSNSSHVALFGLRKTGKTSLLLRLIEKLRASKQLLHVHIDLQRLDSINPSGEYFLWSIGEQLHFGHAPVRAVQGLRLFGQYQTFAEIPDKSAVFELFDHDIRRILEKTTRRFLLLLDEIELMSPEASGSSWGDAYVRCWRLLRGLDQTHGGRLRFLVAGTNPRCVEVNQLNGKENPTYNYFTKHYLGPLAQKESSELAATLGRRTGLVWDDNALKRVHSIVGGHPFLLRTFCSRIHRSLLPRTTTTKVNAATIEKHVAEVLVEINSTLSQVVEVLEGTYSNEQYLLELLASGRAGEFRDMAEAFPDDIAHLIGYGLVVHGTSKSEITIEILQSWLQRRIRNREVSSRKGSTEHHLLPGTTLDTYEIESSVGRSGGFGTVYKARSLARNGDSVALKILHNGSLAALQREVDVLREVSHSSIVQILDHGRFSTGQVYLAMEFLDGNTLKDHCTRASRMGESKATRVLHRLLDALTALHPNELKMAEFATKEELTLSEYRELEVARHGYVHRDIKPENVLLVQGERPVLIDFGIASRVAAPVNTVSGTPGYLPPDGTPGAWTPDVDLYQLGVTFVQVLSGLQYDGANLEDIRRTVLTEIQHPVGHVARKLCNASQHERYRSARDALADLR